MATPTLENVSSAQEQLFNLSMVESTLFWTGLSFFVLLMVVWRYVTPVLGDVLDQRKSRIQEDLDKAEQMRTDAEKSLAEYKEQLKLARNEAQEIVAHAKSEASKIITAKTAELERDIARRSEEAQISIEQAKAKAMRDVRLEMVDLAVVAAEKIMSAEVDKNKASEITDAMLNEIH